MFTILKSIFRDTRIVIEDEDGTCKLIDKTQIDGARKDGAHLFRTNYPVQEIPATLDKYSEVNYN